MGVSSIKAHFIKAICEHFHKVENRANRATHYINVCRSQIGGLSHGRSQMHLQFASYDYYQTWSCYDLVKLAPVERMFSQVKHKLEHDVRL